MTLHDLHASIRGLALMLGLGFAVALAGLIWHTIYLLTHPPRRTYASALSRGRAGDPSELPRGPHGKRAHSQWALRWRGMDLPVWDVVGDLPAGPVLVLSHGWGDSRIGGLTRVPALAEFASRIILWDMPGHGEAPGTCSIGSREVDALTDMIEHLATPVVLYGWSLGAGISIAAGVQAPANVVAVVAEAPYRQPWTPAANVLRAFGLPWRLNLPAAMWLLGIRWGVGPRWRGFDRAVLAEQLPAPLLVIHGKFDQVCPLADGQEIASAAGAKLCVLEGGHHGLWTDPQTSKACRDAVRDFLGNAKSVTPDVWGHPNPH